MYPTYPTLKDIFFELRRTFPMLPASQMLKSARSSIALRERLLAKVRSNKEREPEKNCKITRQISGVEYYQYECKTHDLRWLGGRNTRKPPLCEIAQYKANRQ